MSPIGKERYRPAREVELRDQAVKALRDAIEHSMMARPLQLRAHLAQARCIVEEIDELHALALGIQVVEHDDSDQALAAISA